MRMNVHLKKLDLHTFLFYFEILFIGKYREFHRLYQAGEMIEAADLILSLLTAKLAPRRYVKKLQLTARWSRKVYHHLVHKYFEI